MLHAWRATPTNQAFQEFESLQDKVVECVRGAVFTSQSALLLAGAQVSRVLLLVLCRLLPLQA